jgi:hypothetical protein
MGIYSSVGKREVHIFKPEFLLWLEGRRNVSDIPGIILEY